MLFSAEQREANNVRPCFEWWVFCTDPIFAEEPAILEGSSSVNITILIVYIMSKCVLSTSPPPPEHTPKIYAMLKIVRTHNTHIYSPSNDTHNKHTHVHDGYQFVCLCVCATISLCFTCYTFRLCFTHTCNAITLSIFCRCRCLFVIAFRIEHRTDLNALEIKSGSRKQIHFNMVSNA